MMKAQLFPVDRSINLISQKMFGIPSKKQRSKAPAQKRALFDDDSSIDPTHAEPTKSSLINTTDINDTSSPATSSMPSTKEIPKSKESAFVEELHERALQEDAAIFDYDSYVASKSQSHINNQSDKDSNNKAPRESRYIKSMKDQADLRQMERDEMRVKQMEKQMESEGLTKEDVQVFVTKAYEEQKERLKKVDAGGDVAAPLLFSAGNVIKIDGGSGGDDKDKQEKEPAETTSKHLEEQVMRREQVEREHDEARWDRLKRRFERSTTTEEIDAARDRYFQRKATASPSVHQ